jgi:hypothetical protein
MKNKRFEMEVNDLLKQIKSDITSRTVKGRTDTVVYIEPSYQQAVREMLEPEGYEFKNVALFEVKISWNNRYKKELQ